MKNQKFDPKDVVNIDLDFGDGSKFRENKERQDRLKELSEKLQKGEIKLEEFLKEDNNLIDSLITQQREINRFIFQKEMFQNAISRFRYLEEEEKDKGVHEFREIFKDRLISQDLFAEIEYLIRNPEVEYVVIPKEIIEGLK